MANRYWVGGTASWDGTAGTKWASTSGGAGGASVPTTSDDVFFDASSTGTVTIATGNTGAKSITCTGFTGTLTGSAALTVAGGITLVSGMTHSYSGTLTITGTGTIVTAGKTLSTNLTINGSAITVTLGSTLTISNTLTLTAGTFTTSASNYAVTAGQFSISSTSVRTCTLNGSTITLSASIAWNATTTTNLTFNAGTSTISISGAGPTFNGGGLTYNNVTFTNTTTGTDRTISGTNTISTLTFTAPASGGTIQISITDNQTISTFVCSGATAVRRLFLKSNTIGTQRTLTVTTWSTISDVDFRDIAMNSSRLGTRLSDCGGNSNITFDTPKTVYWNLTGTQSWTATAWATSSGGTPAVNNYPLAQDTAVFDNTGAATTVSLSPGLNFGTINMSARSSAMTFQTNTIGNLYGDLTYGSGITPSGSNTLTIAGRNKTQTLTSAGKTLGFPITVQAIGSTFRLGDALTSSASGTTAFLIENGTFETQNYNLTMTSISGRFSLNGTATKTLTIGSSTISIACSGTAFTASATNTTISSNTGILKFTNNSTAKSFDGGGINYNGMTVDQAGSAILTIAGNNTLGNISNSYSATGATTIRFSGNQTVSDFTATGTVGKVLTIDSTTNGVQRTLTKASGTVSVDYLSIRDSNATGGAVWLAGANSTNVSNNLGWIFSSTPPSTGNAFLLMFL